MKPWHVYVGTTLASVVAILLYVAVWKFVYIPLLTHTMH